MWVYLGLGLVHHRIRTCDSLVEVVHDRDLAALNGQNPVDQARGSGGTRKGIHLGLEYLSLVFDTLVAMPMMVVAVALEMVGVMRAAVGRFAEAEIRSAMSLVTSVSSFSHL